MAAEGLLSFEGDIIELTGTGRLLARAVAMVFDKFSGTTEKDRFSRII
jgi:oxygen-independent coproporphyrinogen-3 oxidase